MREFPYLNNSILYDQKEKTMQHILTSCVACNFCFMILAPHDFLSCIPRHLDQTFMTWWKKASKHVGNFFFLKCSKDLFIIIVKIKEFNIQMAHCR